MIYEHANGITYARYRDPPHNDIPRWPVGGQPEHFLPNGKPADVVFEDGRTGFEPDWDLIVEHAEMAQAYKKFLQVQDKYKAWEMLKHG
jgi:hypothetical protein